MRRLSFRQASTKLAFTSSTRTKKETFSNQSIGTSAKSARPMKTLAESAGSIKPSGPSRRSIRICSTVHLTLFRLTPLPPNQNPFPRIRNIKHLLRTRRGFELELHQIHLALFRLEAT